MNNVFFIAILCAKMSSVYKPLKRTLYTNDCDILKLKVTKIFRFSVTKFCEDRH